MLGGVDMAGAEQDGKDAHGEGHQNGQAIGALHDRHDGFGKQRIGDHGLQGLRHGLQLDRDVGHHANGGDRRNKGAQGLALAIAGREEVGDGGDVLAFGDFGDALQKRPAKGENQDRPDIDRQEIKTRARGDADTAEIGPGGAVDAERQGIDEGAGRAGFSPVGGLSPQVATANRPPEIGQSEEEDHPALQHGPSLARFLPLGKHPGNRPHRTNV